MDTKAYNGWTNYETWCVHLWLTNEEGSYRYWMEEARRHVAEAPDQMCARDWDYTIPKAASYTLSEQLAYELEHAEILKAASMYTDLLVAALESVEWREIAEAFVSEVDVPKSETSADSEPDQKEPSKIVRVLGLAPRFPLGRVVGTPGVLAVVSAEEMATALSRHERGDWGLVCTEDRAANEQAVIEGARLLSVYESHDHTRYWIITEWDRSVTTVLLPSEY